MFQDVDTALEWCEEQLLQASFVARARRRATLTRRLGRAATSRDGGTGGDSGAAGTGSLEDDLSRLLLSALQVTGPALPAVLPLPPASAAPFGDALLARLRPRCPCRCFSTCSRR